MAKDTTGRMHVQVKTGGKRKLSSKLWLERQLNDPYVRRAFPCERLRVADRGLREGMLVEMMREDGALRTA